MNEAVDHLGQSAASVAPRLTGRVRSYRIATLLALILTAACVSLQAPDEDYAAGIAQQLSERGDHAAASHQYLELAAQASGHARQRYLILAARELYSANDMTGAGRILDQVEGSLDATNLPLWAQVLAEVRLASGQPERALAALDQVDNIEQSQNATQLLLLRGEALFRLGRAEEAIMALLEREARLSTSTEVTENQRSIWGGLQTSGAALPLAPGVFPDDPLVAGWLELGYLAYSGRSEPAQLRQNLEQWRLQNPGHPASGVLLQEVLDNLDALMNYPRHTALLLPLTGRQQFQAEAIRDGFLAAHFSLQGLPTRPEISIYDTGRLTPAEAYRRAIVDGVDFIVGPLLKESVVEVAREAGQTTTLALNFLPDYRRTPGRFYQFALSPEDEARQTAERAVAEGHRNALALAPDSDWGQRMLTSFAAELESRDGQLLDSVLYEANSQDFSSAIRGLLLLDQSSARQQRLRENLGQELEFEPRRREDVDLIFVAANAGTAKQIRPQLRFHYAGNIPTYATSAIFQLGSSNNSDLNGIMFPDIPWLIDPDPVARELLQTLGRHWAGQADRRSRLYAMGYDTYRLMPLLNGEVHRLVAPMAGMTGQLYMDDNGRLHRKLSWARIERGRPRLLPDLPTPLAGDIDTAMTEN